MSQLPRAVIVSCSGYVLGEEEAELFKSLNPLGFILFRRNCENPEQLCGLVQSLRRCVGRADAPILIDQEGGRVQRMCPPQWRQYPPASHYGDLCYGNPADIADEKIFTMEEMASDLRDVGINVNCAPVLDVRCDATNEAIGNRCFSDNPEIVFRMGRNMCRSFIDNGITPVIKHLPGQGRAESDSHKSLPVVNATLGELDQRDFVPFKKMMVEDFAGRLWGMVAHVVYTAIDGGRPASVSANVMDFIRNGLEFDGFLLSDDLLMDALDGIGGIADRVHAVLNAGCDAALYCGGDIDEIKEIADSGVPEMNGKSVERYERSRI